MASDDYAMNDVRAIQAAVEEAGAKWEAADTPLMRMSAEEQELHLGYNPPPSADEPSLQARENLAQQNLASFEALARAVGAPASFDLRSVGGRNFITAVKDQKSCGSCVAFGTVATVEGTLRVQRNDATLVTDLSEAHLFYCVARAQGRRCDSGWYMEPAMNAVRDIGLPDDACYPYTPGDQDCTGRCNDWAQRVTKVASWQAISSPAAMKEWIATKGPVAACFTVYQDFMSYGSGIYRHVTGAFRGGHCVCCVGYNDAERYWICKNSWGTSWGETGFFRIGYGEVGIDATMWGVQGVTAPTTGEWLNNRTITGLWAIAEDRNAWVYVRDLGWRRLAFTSDSIFLGLLIPLTSAKAAGRPVNLYLENAVITQAYVL